jgi:hypothetical protein
MVCPDFDSLENEAENFFADINEEEREETRAFLSASLRSFSRADETDHENHGV